MSLERKNGCDHLVVSSGCSALLRAAVISIVLPISGDLLADTQVAGADNDHQANVANTDSKVQPDADGVHWSRDTEDGLRAGVKLIGGNELLAGNELILAYVLKNDSEESKTIDLRTGGNKVYPALGVGNRLSIGWFGGPSTTNEHTLKPGEVLERPEFRIEFPTTGLPDGAYTLGCGSLFSTPVKGKPDTFHGISVRRSIPITIGDPDRFELVRPPNVKSSIAWGNPVAGLRLGTQFVREIAAGKFVPISGKFKTDETVLVRLFVYNASDETIEFAVRIPHAMDGWLMNVQDKDGDHVILEHTYISGYSPDNAIPMKLQPGEQQAFTGVPLKVVGFDARDQPDADANETTVNHAKFEIVAEKPEGWSTTLRLVTKGGRYAATASASVYRRDMPDIAIGLAAGPMPFFVTDKDLTDVNNLPTSIHGFDLLPFLNDKSWEELKSEPIFERGRSLTRGGTWRCRVDSADKYMRWQVFYSPAQQIFYVHDTEFEDIVYGPVPGDAIEKLRLLDGVSDLPGFENDAVYQRRVNGEQRQRTESLLESKDRSLRRHGLRALVTFGDLTIIQQRRWAGLVERLEKSTADANLREQILAAQAYLKAQLARTEALKVQLDQSEYERGREPTPQELELDWGQPVDGLSLAVSPGADGVRKFQIGEVAKFTYLVRNVGDQANRISTLDVLDGVGAIVTDEQSKFSALLTFGGLGGFPRTKRFLLAPGQVTAVKQFSVRIEAGDLHPLHKEFNPRNREFMYGHVKLRGDRTFRIDFYLNLPSAYSESNDKITMPAKGEFDGKLTAPPLPIAIANDDAQEEENVSGSNDLSRIRFWKARVVNAKTGNTIPNVKIRAYGAVAGKQEPQEMDFVSDKNGAFQVPLRDGKGTSLHVLGDGWFSQGIPLLGDDERLGRISAPLAKQPHRPPDPNVPIDCKVWPGKQVTGRLLNPDKTPASGIRLNVGTYINNVQWKKRLGMDLMWYSWDHGDWPNWSTSVVTDEDGVFTTTVPPADARSWVRVGTKELGFGAIDPKYIDAKGEGRALASFVPFEDEVSEADQLTPDRERADEESVNVLDFGDLQLETGVIVRGRVVDAKGNGLAGVDLTTKGPHGPHSGRSTRSGKDGVFEFYPVEPGSITIRPDARLRDEKGDVNSRDVQAVFVDRSYDVPEGDQPLEITVGAVPHTEVEFEWHDRRTKPGQPVAYYGCFKISGWVPREGEQQVSWRGESVLVERAGKQLLVIKTPNNLQKAKLYLTRDRVVTASFEDENGRKFGPGAIELKDFRNPIRRIIYGDDPTKK